MECLGPPDPIAGIDPLYYNTISRLADLYRVHARTMSRWLQPIMDKIRMDGQIRKFTPGEVRRVLEFLGEAE